MFRRAFPILAATLLVACGGSSEPAATPEDPAPATVAPTTSPAASPAASPPSPDSSPASSVSESAGTTPSEAAAVPAALQFTAPLVGGGEIELGALAGRPVLLWFWAPW